MKYKYGSYDFRQVGGQVVTVTEANTVITWVKPSGEVAIIPTLKSLAKYHFYKKTRGIRHYARMMSLLRSYSLY